MEMERRIEASEFRSEGDGKRMRGYAALFERRSQDLGGFVEEIAPGAFNNVLGDDVRALFNHDPNHLLARSPGTMDIGEDERGLWYSLEIPDTQLGRDLRVLMERGDITQSSFGFTVKRDEWEEPEDRGQPIVRTILEVGRLYDVSPVTFPAYPDATVAVRSMNALSDAKKELVSRDFERRNRTIQLIRARQ